MESSNKHKGLKPLEGKTKGSPKLTKEEIAKREKEKRKIEEEMRKAQEASEKAERDAYLKARHKLLQEKLETLKPGETFIEDGDNTYKRLSEQEVIDLLQKNKKEPVFQSEIDDYGGKLECPLCGKQQSVEYLNYGNAGCDCWGYKKVICSDPKCGIYHDFHTCSKD